APFRRSGGGALSGQRDRADAVEAADQLAAAKAKLVSERKAHQATRRELARTQERVAELERLLDRYTVADPRALSVPPWLGGPSRRSKAKHHATAVLLLSDLHLDEVVNPAEINGVNAYDRATAERRLVAVIEGAKI